MTCSLALYYCKMDRIQFDTTDGARILRNLYAFAYSQYKILYKREINERGKSYKDYVYEAIERYLRVKDQLYITTLEHEMLLRSLVRRSIYNDLLPYQRKERKTFLESLEENHLISTPPQHPEEVLRNFPVNDSSKIDRDIMLKSIENALKDDEVVKKIYTAVCIHDFSLSNRMGICKEFGISIDDFNNGSRRFMRIVKKILNK